jgi:hypothetical protein
MAERVAELAAISSRELPPLCAIAIVLDSAKTAANVMIETFIVSSSLWSLNDSNHTDGLGSARLATNPEESDPRPGRLLSCNHRFIHAMPSQASLRNTVAPPGVASSGHNPCRMGVLRDLSASHPPGRPRSRVLYTVIPRGFRFSQRR